MCAAVDKIEEKRKPGDFIGYRKRPRCSALPGADEAEHKRVPRSARDAGVRAKDIRRAPQQGSSNNACGVVLLNGTRFNSFLLCLHILYFTPRKKDLPKKVLFIRLHTGRLHIEGGAMRPPPVAGGGSRASGSGR